MDLSTYVCATDIRSIFVNIYNFFVLPNAQKIIQPREAKITSVGLTSFLTKSQYLAGQFFDSLWLKTVTCQLKFLELPAQQTQESDLLAGFDLDDVGFHATFVKLRTATKSNPDPSSEIHDPKVYFTTEMQAAVQRDGKYASELRKLPQDGQVLLQRYGMIL